MTIKNTPILRTLSIYAILAVACSCLLADVVTAETAGKYTVYRSGGTTPPSSMSPPIGTSYYDIIFCAGGGAGGAGSTSAGVCYNGGGGGASGACARVQNWQIGPNQQMYYGLTAFTGRSTGDGHNANFYFSTGADTYQVSLKGGGAARTSGTATGVLGGLGGDATWYLASEGYNTLHSEPGASSSIPNTYSSGDGNGGILSPSITVSNGLGLAMQIDFWGGNSGADSETAAQSPAKPMNDPINHGAWGQTEYCNCCGGPGAGATPVYWDVYGDLTNGRGGSSNNTVLSIDGFYAGGGGGESPTIINSAGLGGYQVIFVYTS